MSLELIIGSMYSGKTTELIRRVRRFESIGKRVLVFNHALDTRYGDDVHTHYGDSTTAIKLHKLGSFDKCFERFTRKVDVVAIDECQFFPDLVPSVLRMVHEHKLHVLVVGLNGDYRQQLFGDVFQLLPHADDIQFCRAYCNGCNDGTLASFTKRVDGGEEQVEVKSTYTAVCRACLVK